MSSDELTGMFAEFAQFQFPEISPLYARLSAAVADRPTLADPLRAAGSRQRGPLLYFAAIGYVLRTRDRDHPLAGWYATLGGTRPAGDGDPDAALADFVAAHRDEIAGLCATRTTQTNEANRATGLRPAFGRIAQLTGADVFDLVEIGTSAGVLLVADRYACRYTGGGRSATYGDGLLLTCEVRGDGWPEPAAEPWRVGSRTGIDLAPIDAADPRATAWLDACVWPEHTARAERLAAALAIVAAARPTLIAGDLVAELPGAVAAADALPVLVASHVLSYLDASDRAALVDVIGSIAATRDLALVVNGGGRLEQNLFADVPMLTGGQQTEITVVVWRDGVPHVEVQSTCAAHGIWIEWAPRVAAYRPR